MFPTIEATDPRCEHEVRCYPLTCVMILCCSLGVLGLGPVIVQSQHWSLKEWNLYKVLPGGQYEASTAFSRDDIAAE